MAEAHTGACLCGAVRIRTTGELRGVGYCHCSMCRKQTGHVFAATNIPDADLEVTGEESVAWFESSERARRGFCRTCGSALFWKMRDSDRIAVLAGLFDAPTGLKQAGHIFVAEKGDYYDITDGLPQEPGSGLGVIT